MPRACQVRGRRSVVLRTRAVDDVLRVLDEGLEKVGATRGRGDGVKSAARLVGPDDAVCEYSSVWITDRARATCKPPGNDTSARVLGAGIGDREARNAQFLETARTVAFGRNKIGIIGDAATADLFLAFARSRICCARTGKS